MLGKGSYVEAEPLVLRGYEGLQTRESRIPVPLRMLLSEAGERVVQLYEGLGKPDLADVWRTRLGLADLPADPFTPNR